MLVLNVVSANAFNKYSFRHGMFFSVVGYGNELGRLGSAGASCGSLFLLLSATFSLLIGVELDVSLSTLTMGNCSWINLRDLHKLQERIFEFLN